MVCCDKVWELPHCIHALVLSDELNKLLNSQTKLQTALQKKNIIIIRNIKQF